VSSSAESQRALTRLGLAVGAFICSVSFSLLVHTISPLSSPIVAALFIAGGVVGRQRTESGAGQALALGGIVGGITGAIASIALAATGQ
jgi:hypothetical protein